jgi:hypothetical protein
LAQSYRVARYRFKPKAVALPAFELLQPKSRASSANPRMADTVLLPIKKSGVSL